MVTWKLTALYACHHKKTFSIFPIKSATTLHYVKFINISPVLLIIEFVSCRVSKNLQKMTRVSTKLPSYATMLNQKVVDFRKEKAIIKDLAYLTGKLNFRSYNLCWGIYLLCICPKWGNYFGSKSQQAYSSNLQNLHQIWIAIACELIMWQKTKYEENSFLLKTV